MQDHEDELRIPLLEEQVTVEKREVETDRVILRKRVEEFDAELEIPLLQRTFEVERVEVDRRVEAPPPARVEGSTTIYSVVEERVVVTRELYVIQEVWVTEREQTVEERQTVRLKREQLDVQHAPEPSASEGRL